MLITLDQAGTDALPTVLDVLDEAAAWLQSRGIQQWPAQFGGTDGWRADRIADYVERGEAWIVRAGDEPVAVFNVTDKADPDYADGWPHGPGDALYVYRMAVRRVWAGHGVGAMILNWAGTRAQALGLSWVRLDCHRQNRPLQLYYESQGFARVGTLVRVIDDAGTPYTRGSGALYQRPAHTLHLDSTLEACDD